jgi:outer membrane protein OmpA-like peptidoglycan-associated protein
LRVLNGIYLSTGGSAAMRAEDAFGKVVDYGLKSADQSKPLAVKFLFRKNASRFDRYDREYAMWLKQVAQRTAKTSGCLEIVGHTSPTGPAALNDRLSHLRAEHVRDRLQEQARGLHQRLITTGVGSRQTVVGTARRRRDAVDRESSSRPSPAEARLIVSRQPSSGARRRSRLQGASHCCADATQRGCASATTRARHSDSLRA